MSDKLTDWQYWLLQNLRLLSKRYGKEGVVINGKTWRSILIFHFALPPTWERRTSRLLIVLPEKSQIMYTPPERFYLDWGLLTITGKKPAHYFENNDFNDMAKNRLARFSFHLVEGWNPRQNCLEGTTLVDVMAALYKGLESGAREVMS